LQEAPLYCHFFEKIAENVLGFRRFQFP